MTGLEEQAEVYLDRYFEQIETALAGIEKNFPKASDFEIEDLEKSEIGKVLTYLEENSVIEGYNSRGSKPRVYDLTDYEDEDLEEFIQNRF